MVISTEKGLPSCRLEKGFTDIKYRANLFSLLRKEMKEFSTNIGISNQNIWLAKKL